MSNIILGKMLVNCIYGKLVKLLDKENGEEEYFLFKNKLYIFITPFQNKILR